MFGQFRFAARSLARWRGGAVVALATLTVGIATTTSLYALARVLLADLPGVPDVARIGRVYASSASLHVERAPVATQEFESQLVHVRAFDAVGAYAQGDITVGSGPAERTVTVGYASPAFFRVLGVPPASGHVFSDDEASRNEPVAVLSQALASRLFPDRQTRNATVTVNGRARLVVGVMPREFSYGFIGIDADIWLPLTHATPETPGIVAVFAGLKPGITWTAANAELGSRRMGRGSWRWLAIPLEDDIHRRASAAYGFTLGPAIVILLIACVNLACMLLARGIGRQQELAVRRALGASRGRVVRDLLLEHLLLALTASLLGAGVASLLLRLVRAAFAAVQPALAMRVASGSSLLPIAVGTGIVASLLFGALPALRVARADVVPALTGVPSTRRVRLADYGARDLVVFFEVATAVGLVVFASMVLHLFGALQHVRFGFPADRIVAMRVPAASASAIAARVGEIPGVASVTTSSGMLRRLRQRHAGAGGGRTRDRRLASAGRE